MRKCLYPAVVVLMLFACVPPAQNSDGNGVLGPPEETGGGVTSGSGPHLEAGGRVVVEAEHFTADRPDLTGTRMWYLQAGAQAGPEPDPDDYHGGASGEAYLECLPDTRVTHGDPMEPGSFFDNGLGAALSYEIIFATPGMYYVWTRTYATGSEDNGIHVGVDGGFPESGQSMQRCGTGTWAWSNAKRDSGGTPCGVNGTITITITIETPGMHTVTFYQREDGFEFDRFMLTTNPDETPGGAGPVESSRTNP